MYFPYFRGRQYELLALKELALGGLISPSVVPVVEPVKLIPALNNSLVAFSKSKLPIGLVVNPDVGDLAEETETINNLIDKFCISQAIIPSILLNDNVEAVILKLEQKGINSEDILTVLDKRDYLDIYCNLFEEDSPRFTLCPDERLIRRKVKRNKVLFDDRFNKQNRNADYPEDEFFPITILIWNQIIMLALAIIQLWAANT